MNRGILVNQRLKTSIDDIYAAGDIAEVENAASDFGRFDGTESGGKNMAELK